MIRVTTNMIGSFGDAWEAEPAGAPGARRKAGLSAVMPEAEAQLRKAIAEAVRAAGEHDMDRRVYRLIAAQIEAGGSE